MPLYRHIYSNQLQENLNEIRGIISNSTLHVDYELTFSVHQLTKPGSLYKASINQGFSKSFECVS